MIHRPITIILLFFLIVFAGCAKSPVGIGKNNGETTISPEKMESRRENASAGLAKDSDISGEYKAKSHYIPRAIPAGTPIPKDPPVFSALNRNDLKELKRILKKNPESVNTKTDRQMMEYITDKKPVGYIFYCAGSGHWSPGNEYTPLIGFYHYHKGATLLQVASAQGNSEAVKILLSKGVDINALNSSETNALCYAIIYNRRNIVKILIENNVDIKARVFNRAIPLHIASWSNTAKIGKMLIEQGADISAKDKFGCTPLHYAAFTGSMDMVKLLVARGAKIDDEDKSMRTPINYAEYEHHKEIKDYLEESLEKEKAFNALYDGDYSKLKEMVERNPKLLYATTDKPKFEAAKDIDMKDQYTFYCSGKCHPDPYLVHMVSRGKSCGNTSLLHVAASHKSSEPVKILLNEGVNPDIRDNSGRNALYPAITYNCDENVRLLFDKGLNVNSRDNINATPLFIAASTNNADIGKLLIEQGGKVNVKDEYGATPLHYAAFTGSMDMVKLLVDSGAKKNVKDNYKHTPLDYAKSENKREIYKYLKEYRKKDYDGQKTEK